MASLGSPEPIPQPDKPIFPPVEEGGFSPDEKPETAKILPFVRPGSAENKDQGEEFKHQRFELISRGEVVATFYPSFPTKIVSKGEGIFEVWEHRPTGLKMIPFEKIDEVKFW